MSFDALANEPTGRGKDATLPSNPGSSVHPGQTSDDVRGWSYQTNLKTNPNYTRMNAALLTTSERMHKALAQEEGTNLVRRGGKLINETTGQVKNGVRCDWGSGAVFCTPPGWWHSHHNETDEQAWVLPMQDAGLIPAAGS